MMAHVSLLQALQQPASRGAMMQMVMCTVIRYVAKQHASAQRHGRLLQNITCYPNQHSLQTSVGRAALLSFADM